MFTLILARLPLNGSINKYPYIFKKKLLQTICLAKLRKSRDGFKLPFPIIFDLTQNGRMSFLFELKLQVIKKDYLILYKIKIKIYISEEYGQNMRMYIIA